MKHLNLNRRLMSAIEEILVLSPEGITEFDLMAQLDENHPALYPKPDLSDSLLLFQHHFYLKHCLYHLQNELFEADSGYLDIALTRIQLKPLISGDSQSLGEHDPLRDYYLDIRNINKEDAESVDALLKNFWEKLANFHIQPDALSALGLNGDESRSEQKKIYRTLIQKHHPDKGGDEVEFRRIQQAWEQLKKNRH